MIEQILEKLNSLSEEAQAAAIEKAKEKNYDLNKGVVSLTESFTNLNLARATLRDAIEKQKLVQLPLTIQKELSEQLNKVSTFLAGLSSGNDEIENLTNAIELLHTLIWKYGLQNLSEEFLGYHTKLNQLKQLEVEIQKRREELKEGLALKEALSETFNNAQTSNNSLKEILTAAQSAKKTAEEGATKVAEVIQAATQKSTESVAEVSKSITTMQEKASAALTDITQKQTTADGQATKATTSASSATANEGKIKEFFNEIDLYKKKINETSTDAQNTVKQNKDEIAALITNLNDLEGQIKAQIQRAIGHSLFHSFQKRQEGIAKSKMLWVWGLGGLVCISLILTCIVIYTTTNYDAAFAMKLSFSIPIIFAITFCTVQYSRERQLEEEYAFKSNISISLLPYQELVDKIVKKDSPGEQEKYTAFLIDSVNKVFTSPTDKVFGTHDKDSKESSKTLKEMTSMVKTVIKAAKH